MRYRCSLNGPTLARNNWSMNLDLAQLALLQQMDGQRSIRQLADALVDAHLFKHMKPVEFDAYVIQQFQALWQMDFLAMGIA